MDIDIKVEAEETRTISHVELCPRYYVPVTPEMCEKCMRDPVYRMGLIEKKLQIQESGVYIEPCKYAISTREVPRQCCGGQTKIMKMVRCGVYGWEREESFCWQCNRHSACKKKQKIIVYGFPGRYGGAGTELHHQINCWTRMGVDVQLIPFFDPQHEELYNEMQAAGVLVHQANDLSVIQPGDIVINFCSDEFLSNLDALQIRTENLVFVNCMTWLFEKEKRAVAEGKIKALLYQRDWVRRKNQPVLEQLNPKKPPQFLTFSPYFDARYFPFRRRGPRDYIGVGRISRQDADKFAKNTLHIYEYFVAPKLKRGLFLGFDERSEKKIGKPFDWIETHHNQRTCSQQRFYEHCDIVLQPMDTNENWPRVGMEAMASGSVLVVDNRGGWRDQVQHGKTGWLCNSQQEFIYYASRAAFEEHERADMAYAAREHLDELTGFEKSAESWKRVFEAILK